MSEIFDLEEIRDAAESPDGSPYASELMLRCVKEIKRLNKELGIRQDKLNYFEAENRRLGRRVEHDFWQRNDYFLLVERVERVEQALGMEEEKRNGSKI